MRHAYFVRSLARAFARASGDTAGRGAAAGFCDTAGVGAGCGSAGLTAGCASSAGGTLTGRRRRGILSRLTHD